MLINIKVYSFFKQRNEFLVCESKCCTKLEKLCNIYILCLIQTDK